MAFKLLLKPIIYIFNNNNVFWRSRCSRALTEKLKQQINDTQDKYESFIDATQLYKQGKTNEKEYFANIGDYLISTSALDFLAIRVILEMKSEIDKGTLMKKATGGMASSSPPPSPQAGFGIGGFVGTGGAVGGGGEEYVMPVPDRSKNPHSSQ